MQHPQDPSGPHRHSLPAHSPSHLGPPPPSPHHPHPPRSPPPPPLLTPQVSQPVRPPPTHPAPHAPYPSASANTPTSQPPPLAPLPLLRERSPLPDGWISLSETPVTYQDAPVRILEDFSELELTCPHSAVITPLDPSHLSSTPSTPSTRVIIDQSVLTAVLDQAYSDTRFNSFGFLGGRFLHLPAPNTAANPHSEDAGKGKEGAEGEKGKQKEQEEDLTEVCYITQMLLQGAGGS
ncbi:hypothetical protein BDK51DRAFT_43845, partial [Blyttiomyces helicus]